MSEYRRHDVYADPEQERRFSKGAAASLEMLMAKEFDTICEHLIKPMCKHFTWEGTADKVRQHAAEAILDKYMAMLQPLAIAEMHIKEDLDYKGKYEELNHKHAMNLVEEEAKYEASKQLRIEIGKQKYAEKKASLAKAKEAPCTKE